MFPGTLWPGLVAPDRILYIGQIEQTMCANKWLMVNCDSYIVVHETVCKKELSTFKDVIYKSVYKSYIYIYLIYT